MEVERAASGTTCQTPPASTTTDVQGRPANTKRNQFCVTLIHFLPLIKRVSQFLINGKLLLEREKEREAHLSLSLSPSLSNKCKCMLPVLYST